MKKLKMMSLLLVVLLCLTACGGTTTTEEPSDTSGDTSSEENSDVVEFPTQDIRVIVPYAAGGNTDLDGRAIANIIDQNSLLSKTMVVTNITGANTMNAAQSLLDAEPDGHTLLMHHTAFIASSAAGTVATVYKGNIIKNLIMDCQSYTKYRPNETTGGIFVSWRRKEELPTGA